MPLGIVSDDELEREIENSSGGSRRPNEKISEKKGQEKSGSIHAPTQVDIVDIPTRGRSDGDLNVPDSLRQIIGEDAVINGRKSALGLASSFGISASSVSAYAKGATSTASYDAPKESILTHINKSKQRAIGRASKTLNAALGSITQDKLDYSDAKDLSAIAKDCSVIIRNLEPQTPVVNTEAKSPQFVIFAPTFRSENSFESIVVNE